MAEKRTGGDPVRYLDKTFNVTYGGSDAYATNWERIFNRVRLPEADSAGDRTDADLQDERAGQHPVPEAGAGVPDGAAVQGVRVLPEAEDPGPDGVLPLETLVGSE